MKAILPFYNNVHALNEHLTPFVNIDEIFVEHQSWLKKHFLPLISMDLGMLNDEWRGQVLHMLNPFEPYDGYIGECTTKYHNKFVSTNWLAFRLTDDNKYEFLGDERYFAKSSKYKPTDMFDVSVDGKDGCDDFQAYIDESIIYHRFRQQRFYQTGKLLNVYPNDDGDTTAQNWLDSMGGKLSENMKDWLSDWALPAAFVSQCQDDELLITYDDNAFYFIAGVPAYRYGCHGADQIVLLYEPVSRTILFTYGYI
ncbi:MAG: hypothetical protein Q4A69_00885 [Moraxella sp.]|nr:hypothetical protein [Moraxella sp.]